MAPLLGIKRLGIGMPSSLLNLPSLHLHVTTFEIVDFYHHQPLYKTTTGLVIIVLVHNVLTRTCLTLHSTWMHAWHNWVFLLVHLMLTAVLTRMTKSLIVKWQILITPLPTATAVAVDPRLCLHTLFPSVSLDLLLALTYIVLHISRRSSRSWDEE